MTDCGYNGYTKGCRCETCREAKRAYMRAKRAQAKADRQSGASPVGIKHGLAGYQEFSCRCEVCRKAKQVDYVNSRYLRRDGGAA